MADDTPADNADDPPVVPAEVAPADATPPEDAAPPEDAGAVDATPSASAGPKSAEPKPAESKSAASDTAPDADDDSTAHGLGDLDPADQAAIDELLRQASFEDPDSPDDGRSGGGDPAPGRGGPAVQSLDLPSFGQGVQDALAGGRIGGGASAGIDLLRDVDLNVTIELGRSRMRIEDVLKLGEGSVVELDKLAGDPVDVFVNDRLVARGEVLVLNDNFCVRVNEVVSAAREEEP